MERKEKSVVSASSRSIVNDYFGEMHLHLTREWCPENCQHCPKKEDCEDYEEEGE